MLQIKELHHELENKQAKEKYIVKVDELNLPRGEFVAILGTSGCGKTTLLTILGLARNPSRTDKELPAIGQFCVSEYTTSSNTHQLQELYGTADGKRTIEDLRRRLLGFCLQSGELLENLTVQENVEMPMRLNRWSTETIRYRTRQLLNVLSHDFDEELLDADLQQRFQTQATHDHGRVGKLWALRNRLPSKLSGGEYQRVAIARALAHRPEIVFLDEPTGSLDPNTAKSALNTLARTQLDEGVTVVMITHSEDLAKEFAGHIIRMHSPRQGVGTIDKFERKIDGVWHETDANWNVVAEPATATRLANQGSDELFAGRSDMGARRHK